MASKPRKPTHLITAPKINAAGRVKPAAKINVEASARFPCSVNGKEPFALDDQLSNLDKLGARSPEEHYVKSQLTPSRVAQLWGLDAKQVCAWRKNQRWDDLRAAYQKITPVESGGQLVTIDLESEREKFQRRERENWEKMTEKIMEQVDENTYEQLSPTGEVVQLRKNGGHRKQEASALNEANNGARLAMGLATKTTDMFKGANINTGDQITQITVNAPPPRVEAALPAPAVEVEATEGEVLDG